MSGAYYNEIDPFAAEWLRILILFGHIAPGDVDERNILDVRPDDLKGYTQCHFFAGIGVWSYALRQAGWPDDRPVWTGSCPCQPFSAAGKGGGFSDERHLWPAFNHLIGECCPERVYGEQVASKDGLAWLDLVSSDLEGQGYTFGAADLCAAGVGAPHIRQRLFWVGNSDVDERRAQFGNLGKMCSLQEAQRESEQRAALLRGGSGAVGMADDDDDKRQHRSAAGAKQTGWPFIAADRAAIGLANAHDAKRRAVSAGRNIGDGTDASGQEGSGDAESHRESERLADATMRGRELLERAGRPTGLCSAPYVAEKCMQQPGADGAGLRPGPTNGFWRDADWLGCTDGKWRPVEPGTLPLAHGAPNRVGRLRGYGNAINAEVAKIFIEETD